MKITLSDKKEALKKRLSFVKKFGIFIRTQGVLGLAVAFVLGNSVQKVVTALVNDIITPLISIFIGKASDLKTESITVYGAKFLWGDLLATVIDFVVIAFIVYILVSLLRFEKGEPEK